MLVKTYSKRSTEVFVIWLMIWLKVTHAVPRNITIGLLLPEDPPWKLGALRSAAYLAIEWINDQSGLLREDKLKIVYKDSQCSAIRSAGEAAELHYKDDVDVYIGPHCSDSCAPAGLLAAYFKKPMISHSCSATDLSNKDIYPTFARTIFYARSDKENMLKALSNVMDLYKWKLISLIVSKKFAWNSLADYIFQTIESYDKKCDTVHQFDEDDNGNVHFKDILQRAKKTARSEYNLFI